MVIIAVPSAGEGGLKDIMSQRFGRCASFTFVEIKDDKIVSVKTVKNQAANAMGGAGIQSAQIIGNNGATTIIAGFIGPNAADALNAINLKIYHAPDKQITIKEVIDLYIKGELEQITSANVGSHHGMGGGMGRSGGRGGGRGGIF